jgi:hypothetical protein
MFTKETIKVRREKSELVNQQQMDVDNFEQQTQNMSTTIRYPEREKRNFKEQVRYGKAVGKTKQLNYPLRNVFLPSGENEPQKLNQEVVVKYPPFPLKQKDVVNSPSKMVATQTRSEKLT